MKHKNLVFLGTSHIAKQSLEEVKRHIEVEKPDIIALELDKKRLNALMSKAPRKMEFRSIMKIGVKGFLFSLFGAWAEKKLGKLVGVAPGSDMKQAIRIAKMEKIELALLDQDIEITLQRLSKAITWKEKLNFLIDIIKALFMRKKEIEFDLTTVPDKKIIKKLTNKLKERYPGIYRVLIEERNNIIAKNLQSLMSSNESKKILVILGAGHVDDVLELIKEPKISFSFSIGQNQYV
ncbi:TraB/GumN family protein [Candidatus Woesearchaeota archaeon]|nr:TraB/GumN family protein [Candidatus Woesearchaeota archaeon]